MKPENKSTQAISAQVHDWAVENRQLRKELLSREKRVEELEAMVSSLNKQLSVKIDQINDMVQKLMAFMTGDAAVNLSESLRQSIVAEVRSEFEVREQELEKRTLVSGRNLLLSSMPVCKPCTTNSIR